MFRVTTGRAISDYWIASRGRSRDDDDSEGGGKVSLPGLIGATKYQRTWELDRRLARNLIEKCDEALETDKLSDSNRASIEQTRRTVEAALAAYQENDDG